MAQKTLSYQFPMQLCNKTGMVIRLADTSKQSQTLGSVLVNNTGIGLLRLSERGNYKIIFKGYPPIKITLGQMGDSPEYLTGLIGDKTPQLYTHLNITNNGFLVTAPAGESLSKEDLCVLTNTGKYIKADATNITKSNSKLLIAFEDIPINKEGVFIERGYVATTMGLNLGGSYYMSETAGAITNAVPAGVGKVKRFVGYGVDTNLLFFDSSNDYTVL